MKTIFGVPRNLVFIAASLFTWGVGEGMFLYFQPIYLQKWGANPVEIGAILGMMGIAMAVAQAPAGWLADRIGARPVMWSSWVLGTAAAVMMALAGSLPMFIAGMLTYGLTSFVVAPMNSYITSARGKWSVERALTVVSAMFHLGAVAGPLIGGAVGEAVGLQNVYRISAVIFVISTIMVFRCGAQPVEEHIDQHAEKTNLLNNPRFVGLLGLISLTMFALYLPQPLTPSYLNEVHGFDFLTIGSLGAVASLGNALIMLALGHLSAPVGFIIGQVLVALFALLMWRSQAVPLFYIGYFFIGGYRLCRSMALARARALVKSSEIGLAFGLMETGNAVAVIFAPLAAGFLYERDPKSIYLFSLIALGIVIALNTLLLPRRSTAKTVQPELRETPIADQGPERSAQPAEAALVVEPFRAD